MQAALGLLQLQYSDQVRTRRAEIAARYRDAIDAIPGLSAVPSAGQSVANHAYFPIPVGDDCSLSRDALYDKHFPMYRGLPSAQAEGLPVASDAAARVICLPIYPDLDDADQDRIIEQLSHSNAV